jgi:hypothetical protein
MKKLTLHEKWDSEKDEEIKVIKRDGRQLLIYPDGREEALTPDHPRWDHWAGK